MTRRSTKPGERGRIIVDAQKRAALEAAGWKVGDAADFLGLTEEEQQITMRRHRGCRFRSERVPLFRASGDHLSGCGAIRLTMLRDRANSPAWLAPARWLRGVAIGGPRPKRCPVEHPRDVTVELLAQRDGSLEEAQPGRRGVQIQLITT